jgi:hypothetical protein
MADLGRMTIEELASKVLADEHGDWLREAVAFLVEALTEAEVEQACGAGYRERSPERINVRNGYRARPFKTRVGEIELQIPKLRQGSYFPGFLEPRKVSEQALVACVQEAYVNGVSRARSTGWWRHSAWPGSPRTRCRGSAGRSTSGSPLSTSGRSRAPTPTSGWTPRCATRHCRIGRGGRPHRRAVAAAR